MAYEAVRTCVDFLGLTSASDEATEKMVKIHIIDMTYLYYLFTEESAF